MNQLVVDSDWVKFLLIRLQQARKAPLSSLRGVRPGMPDLIRLQHTQCAVASEIRHKAANSNSIFYESLILAQDERWRRA